MAKVSLPTIHKRAGNWLLNTYETSVVTLDGITPLAITFDRTWTGNYATGFTVRNLLTSEVIAQRSWCGGLGCAIVVDGLIHIFGSTQWVHGNRIIHSVLDAEFNPSQPTTIHQADGNYLVFNTEICATPSGFTMVIETSDAAGGGIYFLTSGDLVSWRAVPNATINQGQYCACPSIHYLDGWYYLTYLSRIGSDYVTQVSRSQDLLTWQNFTGNAKYPDYICLLSPTPSAGEGNNVSDVSMVECGGKVYGVCLIGDQVNYGHLRTFLFLGTLRQLFKEFFE